VSPILDDFFIAKVEFFTKKLQLFFSKAIANVGNLVKANCLSFKWSIRSFVSPVTPVNVEKLQTKKTGGKKNN
jgi:hypothetical protein